MDAANDYNLSAKQKLDYMHHVLEGEAKRLYREKILSSCATFAEASSMMQEEFNSLTRQNRVRKHLQKLKLSTIVGNRRCTVTEALEELRVLCAAKNETSVEIMGRMFCCNFLRNSLL
jgi:hypothetical protein